MTNRELLQGGIEGLKEAGIEDAETDARILFEYVTGLDRNALLLKGDEEAGCTGGGSDPAGDAEGRYMSLIEERAGGRPVQYITGEADFMGLRFIVNESVLIPRFDTEFLVEEMMREIEDGSSVLDMCTGSGCILLSLMRYKNGIKGTGADISQAALKVALQNEKLIFMQGGFSEHDAVNWRLSDMFENITGKYDYIVSNPPYIKTAVIATLATEVKDHEPYMALDGDADGLKYYRSIASEAGAYLNRHGRLYLEIGYDEAEEVTELLRDGGFTKVEALKDYAGNYRVVKAEAEDFYV